MANSVMESPTQGSQIKQNTLVENFRAQTTVSGNEQLVTPSGSCLVGSPAAAARGASENGLYVAFYEAAGRVKSVLPSVL